MPNPAPKSKPCPVCGEPYLYVVTTRNLAGEVYQFDYHHPARPEDRRPPGFTGRVCVQEPTGEPAGA